MSVNNSILLILAIHCVAPPKPKHGFIYSPCNTRFGSQCFAGCDNGYYINGTAKISCSVKGTWEPTQITCHGKAYMMLYLMYWSFYSIANYILTVPANRPYILLIALSPKENGFLN